MGRAAGRPCPGRRIPARLRRDLGAGPGARGGLPHHPGAGPPGAGPRRDPARPRPLSRLRGQPALDGEPASPGRPERRAHPRGPQGGDGPGALPARPRPPSAPPAAPAHPHRRRGGARQDPGGGDPGERADRARPGAADPGAGRQEHAHAVPEGVLEPLHHPADPARLHRHPAGAEPDPDQPQSLPLLRQGDHLDRHPQAGRRVPHVPGTGVLGRHRDRRGPQRRRPRHGLATQPPRPPAGPALRHPRHAFRDPARRPGAELREPDEHAGRHRHRGPGRLLPGGLPGQGAGDPAFQEGRPGPGPRDLPRPGDRPPPVPGLREGGGRFRGPARGRGGGCGNGSGSRCGCGSDVQGGDGDRDGGERPRAPIAAPSRPLPRHPGKGALLQPRRLHRQHRPAHTPPGAGACAGAGRIIGRDRASERSGHRPEPAAGGGDRVVARAARGPGTHRTGRLRQVSGAAPGDPRRRAVHLEPPRRPRPAGRLHRAHRNPALAAGTPARRPRSRQGPARHPPRRHERRGPAARGRGLRQRGPPGAPPPLLRRRLRGDQPALPLPSAHPLRHAVVTHGLPAAQRPGGPLRAGAHATHRLPRDGERERDDPRGHAHPRSPGTQGRAGIPGHRRSRPRS